MLIDIEDIFLNKIIARMQLTIRKWEKSCEACNESKKEIKQIMEKATALIHELKSERNNLKDHIMHLFDDGSPELERIKRMVEENETKIQDIDKGDKGNDHHIR